ncbi:MAG: leucyl aminopeptidase family protein, partial [Proteobacteria bacterium]|nr:leucyl aminopeptidase family protein [Pseudomonadota bacterium]
HKGSVTVIKGDALLKGFPMVHAVGRAASVPPHLVDITFARKGAPKVTLVGKGVTFDSGGLDIKSASNMKMMKKDMGGAAAVLALAKVIIDMKLPVQLRVLLPIVENAISGNAMRPLDIVTTRKGITVEIGNTDAEGRLILCDALCAADEEKPDLIIDCATLTGAARVALGTELPAFFTPSDALASELIRHASAQADPMWRLPLWKNYRKQLDTPAAELSNDPDSSFGGAITAALYLQEFVSTTPNWLHIDMMAWNLIQKPGRPQGGEAMAVRALFALLKDRYGTGQRR